MISMWSVFYTYTDKAYITNHAQLCNSQVSYGVVHSGPRFGFCVDKCMSFQHITQHIHT